MNPFGVNVAQAQYRAEKSGIKKIGQTAGLCVIGYVAVQNFIALVMMLLSLDTYYYTDAAFESCANIIYTILGVLVPFAIGGFYLRKKTGTEFLNFNKPKGGAASWLLVGFGLFTCLCADYVTSWIVTIAEYGGVELTSPEYGVPDDIPGRVIYTLSVAVIPPLCEELAMRGVVMQPLRKYGDKFAIIASAAVFAILHGNLVQAPFALMVGFVLGYIACVTESLWIPIVVHALNNLYSVITEFMIEDIKDEEALNKWYTIILVALYVVSIAMTAIYFLKKDGNLKLDKKITLLPGGQKAKAFMLNIPMIIAVIIMLVITSAYVSSGSDISSGITGFIS